MRRDVWTEATGSQRSGQQTAAGGRSEGHLPGGGPTLLLTSCAQGARPEAPHPHLVRSSTHSLGAALHRLMKPRHRQLTAGLSPSTQHPFRPLPAPQDHQGAPERRDWGSQV